MGRQFIRLPGYIENEILNIDPGVFKILGYIYSKSFYDAPDYKPIEYSSNTFSKVLGMSRTTVTAKIRVLAELGYIRIENKLLYPIEYPCPKNEQKGILVQKMNKECSKNEHSCSKNEQSLSKNWTKHPVYDRLEQGFPTLLVLLKYFYSKTTVVLVVDFITILRNCHKMEVFIMARKENFTDPGDKMLGFKNNNKFQGCIKWILAAYEEDDNSGDDLPMDRYLLYLLLDCIRNGKKPEGRFISAITKLQNDGERFPIDLTEAKLIDEKDAAAIEMARREQATLRMVDDLDKPIESTRVGDINLLEMFKNKKSEVN